jgi:hypothetical protein
MMATSPICLLQWLEPGEYRETQAALDDFAGKVNIEHADVRTSGQAAQALQSWFKNNAGNTQYCFVGTHGILGPDAPIGVGATAEIGGYAEWHEIWDWFSKGDLMGGLWLGACKSSHAAAALSPLLAKSAHPVIPHIYGFKDEIYPYPEIEHILLKLMEFTDTTQSVPLDEELELLRAAVPGTAIELYFPVASPFPTVEYVNVDQMPDKIGMDFRQLLQNQAAVGSWRHR